MDFGNLVIILIALYFIVKWAVKNGIKEANTDIKSTIEENADEQVNSNLSHSFENKACHLASLIFWNKEKQLVYTEESDPKRVVHSVSHSNHSLLISLSHYRKAEALTMTANLAYSIQGIRTQEESLERNISKAHAYNEIYPEKQENYRTVIYQTQWWKFCKAEQFLGKILLLVQFLITHYLIYRSM